MSPCATTRWEKPEATFTVQIPDGKTAPEDSEFDFLHRKQLIAAAEFCLELKPYQESLMEFVLPLIEPKDRNGTPKDTDIKAKHVLKPLTDDDNSWIHSYFEAKMGELCLGNVTLCRQASSTETRIGDVPPIMSPTAQLTITTAGRTVGPEWKSELCQEAPLLPDWTGDVARSLPKFWRAGTEDGKLIFDVDALPRFDAVRTHVLPNSVNFDSNGEITKVYQVKFEDVCSTYAFDNLEPFSLTQIDGTPVQVTEASLILSLFVGNMSGKSD